MIKKKLIILITNSLGELDATIPICIELDKKYNLKIEFVFVVSSIYEKFKKNKFYSYIISKFNFSYSYLFLRNKFDLQNKKSFFGKKFLKIYHLLKEILSIPMVLYKIISADYIFYEFTEQSSTRYIFYINSFISKKIFTYCHGVALHPMTTNTLKPNAHKTKYLLYHKMNLSLSDSMGYSNHYLIGLPKFYSNWTKLIENIPSSFLEEEPYVLVFTRSINEYYMPKKIYDTLIKQTYDAITEVYQDINIIFKPHPREDISYLEKILKKNEMKNTKISNTHATILAKNATFAISHWTSCVIDCLSIKAPVIEFFIEGEKFREVEPDGSTYKNIGVMSCDNLRDLKKSIKLISDDKYMHHNNLYDSLNYKDILFLE